MDKLEGSPLSIIISERKVLLSEFLTIAIKATDAIGEIHRKNIIHMNINPENILWNEDEQVLKIVDFDTSLRMFQDYNELAAAKAFDGSMAYVSPEQTGRMNRTIDYRSDYYSFGITLYELITGEKPFETDDMLEMIHSHIARVPQTPREKNPDIPKSISDIIMKLISKNAEDRYQSSFGINCDLKKADSELKETGIVSDFIIGQKDISEKFEIPQKLYGREKEIKTLINTFDLVCTNGDPQTIMISGFSGIGKTSLVHEVYKHILERKGVFISGKVEQFTGNRPYLPIINAFGEFIRQILSESEEQFIYWKNTILAAVGNNGQLIVNVIPQLEVIIGKQPQSPELESVSAQNRFRIVFENFIKCFATKEHPLVMFIDDLQWADSSTLKMIELFLTDSGVKNIYFIGAYRDNEVNDIHPLVTLFNEKNNIIKNFQIMKLGPLSIEDVCKLIQDTLKCDYQRAGILGSVCFKKTMGNPFFLNQLLISLYRNNLIRFDYNSGSWSFDISKIQEQGITENVVELMISNIRKLPEETQNALKTAAVIGHSFSLRILSKLIEKSETETLKEMWVALKEGIILPAETDYKYINEDKNLPVSYRFLHDKVQQAAYLMIPEDIKKRLHMKAGRLLKSTSKNNIEENIFDIVNHFNIAVDLITTDEEKEELANLNSIAGKKALDSISYDMAIGYFKTCIGLLGKAAWEKNYTLMVHASIELTKLFFMVADYDAMQKTGETILENSNDILDKVKVNEIFIRALYSQSKLQEAILYGVQTLKLLGFNSSVNPGKISVLKSIIEVKYLLRGKSIEDLIYLPEMQDEKFKRIIRLLDIIHLPAHLINRNLSVALALNIVKYTIKYGNTASGSVGYSILCAALSALGFINEGYKFGELALEIAYKYNSQENVVTTGFIFYNSSHHFKHHIKESIPWHKNFCHMGIEIGNFEFGALNAMMYCTKSFYAGKRLEELKSDLAFYSNLIIKLKQESALYVVKTYHQMVLNLLGESEYPCVLTGEIINECEFISALKEKNIRTHLGDYYCNKILLLYMFNEYFDAVEYCEIAHNYLESVEGTYSSPMFNFYESLSYLANYKNMSYEMKRKSIRVVRINQRRLKKIVLQAPMNYMHKYYLVEAEIAKEFGDATKALEYYERAINAAAKNGYIYEEAIASERAAIYYFSQKNERVAIAYLEYSIHCYEKWGAKAKVKHLIETYSDIHNFNIKGDGNIGGDVFQIPAVKAYKNRDAVDLTSVIKASQAISEEIEYRSLIKKLIKILIENAGAQKVILLKKKEEELTIEATYQIGDEEPTIAERKNLEKYVPLSMIKLAERTAETLVISDAQKSEFRNDAYVKTVQPKSVFCIPLVHQGTVRRILYFENNLAVGAFTPEKVEMINMLSAQMVISIENAELYQRAVTDGLTQIFNRGFFDNYLSKSVYEAQRYNEKLSILLMDIDCFKKINDIYGHQIGDLVLKNAAKNIAGLIRKSDIVARYGGEEFVVLLPKTGIDGAKDLAEKIRGTIENAFVEYADSYRKLQLKVTISIGTAELQKDDDTNSFVEKADKNLYIAKETGRNKVV